MAENKLFVCISCDFASHSADGLSRHLPCGRSAAEQPFRCRQLECGFEGKSWPSLRTHLINGHKMRAESTAGSRREDDFRCRERECPYSGHNGHALRLHLLKRHNIRVVDNACTQRRDICRTNGETGGQSLRCPRKDCRFVGKSAIAVRTHVINGHERRGRKRKAEEVGEQTANACLFPKCGQQFGSSRELREHIQWTHKRRERRKCYFPDCRYETADVRALKHHLLQRHPNPSQAPPSPPSQTQTQPLFRCRLFGCRFPGSRSLKGLRIHTKKNHAKKPLAVEAPSDRRKPSSGASANKALPSGPKRQLSLQEKRRQLQHQLLQQVYEQTMKKPLAVESQALPVIETSLVREENRKSSVMVFKCSKCVFFSQNVFDLRTHLRSAH